MVSGGRSGKCAFALESAVPPCLCSNSNVSSSSGRYAGSWYLDVGLGRYGLFSVVTGLLPSVARCFASSISACVAADAAKMYGFVCLMLVMLWLCLDVVLELLGFGSCRTAFWVGLSVFVPSFDPSSHSWFVPSHVRALNTTVASCWNRVCGVGGVRLVGASY